MKFLKDLLFASSFLSLAVRSSPLALGVAQPPQLHSRQADQTTLVACLKGAKVPYSVSTSSDWAQLIKPYNLRLQYIPAAVTLPTTVQHVSDSVTCASASDLKVQPKSGGHSYASFSSGGQNGSLIVDLQNFNTIEVDSSTNVASVGSGVRLGNLGLALWAQGKRALPYGTGPGVGVGGHFSHGGYGHASRRWGLALDTIVALDVVLANGTFVHATSTAYPEVFFAMRGAADAFGIATTFYLQTMAAPENVVNWRVEWPALGTAKTMASAFLKLQAMVLNGQNDFDRNTSFGLQTGGTGFDFVGWYMGPSYNTFNDVILPGILSGFPTPESTTLKNLTWIDSLQFMAAPDNLSQPLSGYDAHDTFYAKSIVTKNADPITSDAALSFWSYIIDKGQSISSVGAWFTIINIYGGHDSQINVPASGSSAYGDRDALWVIQNYGGSTTWDPSIEVFIDDLNGALTSAQPNGSFSAYINYVDPELTATQAAQLYYGQDLYDRLVSIKKLVDPQDVFWNPQAIGNEGSVSGTVPATSSDGSCGTDSGTTCTGSVFGTCCSSYGYCGTGAPYCETSNGCQLAWGICDMASPTTSASSSTLAPTLALPVSQDGSCGSTATCVGSTFGDCCSSYNYCGTGELWCGAGCQDGYGICDAAISSSSVVPPSPIPSLLPVPIVSTDGWCGLVNGTTCAGSTFGECCSSYNHCGTGDLWCGPGCQKGYGSCNAVVSSSPVAAIPIPTSTPANTAVSTDGSCGAASGFTCGGSTFGLCCSSYNYCGTGELWCGAGCQKGFGECDATSAPATGMAALPALAPISTTALVSFDGSCGISASGSSHTCMGSIFGNCCSSAGYCGATNDYCSAVAGCQSGFGSCVPLGVA